MKDKDKIIAIGGLTASGKTSLSIQIAKKFHGEIISADSRQIYRDLNIGTAKEKIDHLNKDRSVIINGVIHHLIDIIDPDENFNLAIFQKLAVEKIKEISDKKFLPIIVGGTGLYIDSVIYGYNLTEEKFDRSQRVKLSNMTVQELQKLLRIKSRHTFLSLNNSDQNNRYRLIRRIEKLSSTVKSTIQTSSHFNCLYLAIKTPTNRLSLLIDKRVDDMFEEGLLQENKTLRQKGYTTDLSSMKSIGYKEFDEYFNGTQTLDETKELIKLHTRQYAKRQITWFKRNKDILWVSGLEEAEAAVEKFLNQD